MFERVTVLSSPSNVRTRQHKKPDTTMAYFSVVPNLGTGYCLSSARSSSPAQEVNDQNHQSHNQQYVDQASADMQTETQKPQNQKNNKNRPKHVNLPFGTASVNVTSGKCH
jgi:phage-related protein